MHQYLYARKVYPELLFDQRSIYGTTVFHSQHPDIAGYITRVLDNAVDLLDKDAVDRLLLTITSSATSRPVECLILTCSAPPPATVQQQQQQQGRLSVCDELEENLRAALLKILMVAASKLRALSDDCSFALALSTRQSASSSSSSSGGAVEAALRSGEWRVDSATTPGDPRTDIAMAMDTMAAGDGGGSHSRTMIKSFNSEILGTIECFVQSFSK